MNIYKTKQALEVELLKINEFLDRLSKILRINYEGNVLINEDDKKIYGDLTDQIKNLSKVNDRFRVIMERMDDVNGTNN